MNSSNGAALASCYPATSPPGFLVLLDLSFLPHQI